MRIEKVKKKIARVMHNKIEKEREDWPPTCMAIWYEPKRPSKDRKQAGII